MVRSRKKISISRQCELLDVSRRSHYYEAIKEDEKNLSSMKEIDGIYLNHAYYSSRRMLFALKDKGYEVSRHTIRRLMRKMGLYAIYQRPRTSKKNDEHKIYPYLLRDLIVDKPSVVLRHHVYPCKKRVYVSRCGDGLVFKKGVVVEIVE